MNKKNKKKIKNIILVICVVFFSVFFTFLVSGFNFGDAVKVKSVTTTYNYINNTNISEYWNTAEGVLDDVADIQGSWITNDLGWIVSAGSNVFYWANQSYLNETNLVLSLNTTANLQELLNSTGIYSTFNTTYHGYAVNVSINWTEVVFNAYNTTWDNSWLTALTDCDDGHCSTVFYWANQSYLNETDLILSINTTVNLQQLLNSTGIYSTYNATYHSYASNVSKNWTENTYNTYNTIWSASSGMSNYSNFSNYSYYWGSNINNTNSTQFGVVNGFLNLLESWLYSFLENVGLIQNSSYLSTYNETYHSYGTNVSTNWTEVVFTTYNTTWDDTGLDCSDGHCSSIFYWSNQSYLNETDLVLSLNTTGNIQELLNSTGIYGTYNITYHNYAANVSLNYTEIVFNTYNDTWDNSWLTALTDCDDGHCGSVFYWANQSYLNETNLVLSLNTTTNIEHLINSTIANMINIYLGNANGSYLSTFNSTYDSYAGNVSKNWTEETYNTYEALWGAGMDSGEVNTTINQYLGNANESYLDRSNATYEGYPAQWNISINQYLTNANESYLDRSNATYESYATNVSINWTELTFNTYNTTWDDVGAGENVNASINIYLSRANASYLDRSNLSYESFNTTVNIQQLYNLTASLIANFSINDYLNKTINMYFIGANASQSADVNASINDYLNKTINFYLNDGTNASYLTTYNATYHSFSTNVSLNYTEIIFTTYDSRWYGGNASWNESYADTKYVNFSSQNTTQLEYEAGFLHIVESWIVDKINALALIVFNANFRNYFNQVNLNISSSPSFVSLNLTGGYIWNGTDKFSFTDLNATGGGGISSEDVNVTINVYLGNANASYLTTFNATYHGYPANWNTTINQYLTNANASYLSTFNTTYHAYSENVSKNWTEITYDTYNAIWGAGMTSANVNATINQYLNSGTNASYLSTYNSTYHGYTSAWNVSINQYLTNANASYLTTFNSTYHALIQNSSYLTTYNITYHGLIQNASYLTTYNASYHSYNTTANAQSLINNTNLLIANITLGKGGYMIDNGTTTIIGHT